MFAAARLSSHLAYAKAFESEQYIYVMRDVKDVGVPLLHQNQRIGFNF